MDSTSCTRSNVNDNVNDVECTTPISDQCIPHDLTRDPHDLTDFTTPDAVRTKHCRNADGDADGDAELVCPDAPTKKPKVATA